MRQLICMLLLLLFSAPLHAATWFAGVGNDGYISDVNGIYAALENRISGLSANKFIYENQPGTGILNSIQALGTMLDSGDTLIWYYSGHAGFELDEDSDETAAGSTATDEYDETLVLQNSDDQVSDDALAGAFDSLSSNGITLLTIFDTCYAGGFIGGMSDLNTVANLTFMGSSMEYEKSYAYPSDPYSIFTTGLIAGLENLNADTDQSGDLSLQEWFEYSHDYTISDIDDQHPVFYGDSSLILVSSHPVPIPGAGLLLVSGLFVLCRIKRQRQDPLF